MERWSPIELEITWFCCSFRFFFVFWTNKYTSLTASSENNHQISKSLAFDVGFERYTKLCVGSPAVLFDPQRSLPFDFFFLWSWLIVDLFEKKERNSNRIESNWKSINLYSKCGHNQISYNFTWLHCCRCWCRGRCEKMEESNYKDFE